MGRCKHGKACRFSHDAMGWQCDAEPNVEDDRAFAVRCESSLSNSVFVPHGASTFLTLLAQAKEDGFPDAFVDQIVSIEGLQSAQHLNGLVGRVTEVDHRKRRCGIAFQSGAPKSI